MAFSNKSPEDVKKFSDAFWKKWNLIENGQKYIERIEKGESEIEKYRLTTEAIEVKYRNTFRDHLNAKPEDLDFKGLTIDSITLFKNP